jgi:hypothetical protein
MTETEFVEIRKVRMILRDPIGVNDLIYADSFPDKPDTQAGYYISGLGNYQKYNERKNVWERLVTKLSDVYITETLREKGFQQSVMQLIDFIIMGLQSGAISFSAGAERVSGPSLSELLELYREQKKILLEQVGLNVGRTMRTRRPAVGGVLETW